MFTARYGLDSFYIYVYIYIYIYIYIYNSSSLIWVFNGLIRVWFTFSEAVCRTGDAAIYEDMTYPTLYRPSGT